MFISICASFQLGVVELEIFGTDMKRCDMEFLEMKQNLNNTNLGPSRNSPICSGAKSWQQNYNRDETRFSIGRHVAAKSMSLPALDILRAPTL